MTGTARRANASTLSAAIALLTFAAALALPASSFGQAAAHCPVLIREVDPGARRAVQGSVAERRLRIGYQSNTRVEIERIVFHVHFAGAAGDFTSFRILPANAEQANDWPDEAFDVSSGSLPEVTLNKVTFRDGTVWSDDGSHGCAYQPGAPAASARTSNPQPLPSAADPNRIERSERLAAILALTRNTPAPPAESPRPASTHAVVKAREQAPPKPSEPSRPAAKKADSAKTATAKPARIVDAAPAPVPAPSAPAAQAHSGQATGPKAGFALAGSPSGEDSHSIFSALPFAAYGAGTPARTLDPAPRLLENQFLWPCPLTPRSLDIGSEGRFYVDLNNLSSSAVTRVRLELIAGDRVYDFDTDLAVPAIGSALFARTVTPAVDPGIAPHIAILSVHFESGRDWAAQSPDACTATFLPAPGAVREGNRAAAPAGQVRPLTPVSADAPSIPVPAVPAPAVTRVPAKTPEQAPIGLEAQMQEQMKAAEQPRAADQTHPVDQAAAANPAREPSLLLGPVPAPVPAGQKKGAHSPTAEEGSAAASGALENLIGAEAVRRYAGLIHSHKASLCSVTTYPEGATVKLDGQDLGVTPIVFVALKKDAGAGHLINVSLAGFEPAEYRVFPDGQNFPLSLHLEKLDPGNGAK